MPKARVEPERAPAAESDISAGGDDGDSAATWTFPELSEALLRLRLGICP